MLSLFVFFALKFKKVETQCKRKNIGKSLGQLLHALPGLSQIQITAGTLKSNGKQGKTRNQNF